MFVGTLLLGLTVYLLYRWVTAKFDFFKDRGVPYDKPFPIFGSMKDVVFRKKSILDLVVDLYNKTNKKVYGVFDQRNPVFLIRDPEIVKQVTIKHFDHFVNHRTIFGDEDDNLFASSLFAMQNDKWKDMRSTLSPVFTGSKMRHMFQLMNQVAQDTTEHLKKLTAESMKGSIELDFKDYCTRFANDIIASTAFGLQVNSYEQPKNEFFLMGKKVTNFSAWQNFKFFMYATLKPLMKLFKVQLFDKKSSDYFMRLVLDAMKYRAANNIVRPDMINMLMEARGLVKSDNPKTHNREWTDIDIVAQCFLFFFAGFETTATLVCFSTHELMENPDIQAKLYEEIDEVCQQLDGQPLTYEILQGMKYLDMVISESLRKWPGAVFVDRVCNKDFQFITDNGERFAMKKNDCLWLPVAGFHRDPKYFENPNKFMPERFSDDNKDNIKPLTYFPFGVGPRNCIGSRFALLEAKSFLFYLIRNFRIEAAKKSTVPLELGAIGFQLLPKTGFWLKFVPREQNS